MVNMGFVNEANSGFDIEILFTVNVRYYKPFPFQLSLKPGIQLSSC